MLRRLILLIISSVTLLASAVPAAQATGPLITNSKGEAAKTIVAVSEDTATHIAESKISCTTVNLHVEVTKNANTTANGHGTGTMEGFNAVSPETHTGHCRYGPTLATVTGVTAANLHLTKTEGETKGTAYLSYTLDVYLSNTTLISECTHGGNVTWKRTGANTINIHGTVFKTGGGGFCAGMGTFTGNFEVLDEFGLPVTIH